MPHFEDIYDHAVAHYSEAAKEQLSLPEIADICKRLFDYRKAQPWPSFLKSGTGWEERYAAAIVPISESSRILPTVQDAICWANDLIADIDAHLTHAP